MEIAAISDVVSSITYSTQVSCLSDLLLNRSINVISVTDASSDQGASSTLPFHVSAVSRPNTRTITKPRLRKSRRLRMKILVGDNGGDEMDEFYGFSDGGVYNGGGGYFGGGGGGKGWNFGGHGGWNWEEFSDNSISDPAFDFVYEVLRWIAMSNCLHFAVKRLARFVSDGIGHRGGKVPMPLPQVC